MRYSDKGLYKFPEFFSSKIRFLIGFHRLVLLAFAVSFPNGGSTFITKEEAKILRCSVYFEGALSIMEPGIFVLGKPFQRLRIGPYQLLLVPFSQTTKIKFGVNDD